MQCIIIVKDGQFTKVLYGEYYGVLSDKVIIRCLYDTLLSVRKR